MSEVTDCNVVSSRESTIEESHEAWREPVEISRLAYPDDHRFPTEYSEIRQIHPVAHHVFSTVRSQKEVRVSGVVVRRHQSCRCQKQP